MRIGIIALGMTFAACSGGERADARADVPVNSARVVLSIGSVEGRDPYVFGRILGMTQDTLGNIYVADGQADEIRAFGPDGAFQYLVARRGAGPDEVSGPCCLAIDPGGDLWTRDSGNGRYVRFRLLAGAAHGVATYPMRHAAARWAVPTTFLDGGFVDLGQTTVGDGRTTTLFIVRDSSGTVLREDSLADPSRDSLDVDVVQQTSGNSRSTFYLYRPFGSIPLHGFGNGGWSAVAASGYYVVRLTGPGGGARVVRQPVVGPALSERETRLAADRLDRQRKQFGTAHFDMPETKAPLRGLMFDRAGRLWVELAQPDGAQRRADVYDTTGARVAQVVWPSDVALALGWIGDSTALGMRRDSLDVQYVVRLAWSP